MTCRFHFILDIITLYNFLGREPTTEPEEPQERPATQPVAGRGRGRGRRHGRGRGRGRGQPSQEPAQEEGQQEVGQQEDRSDKECAICLSSQIPRHTMHILLPCKHKMLHSTCFNRWRASGHNNCPVCRVDVQRDLKYSKWVEEQLAAIEASTF